MWSRPQRMMAPLRPALLRPSIAFAPRFHGISHRLTLVRQASSSSHHNYPDPLDHVKENDEDLKDGYEITEEDVKQLEAVIDQRLKEKELALRTLAEDAKQPGVIEKFGWYPTIGLTVTALLGKEMIILSPATLLGTYTFVALGLGWLLAGESIRAVGQEMHNKEKQQQIDLMDAFIELNKADIDGWKVKGVEARLLEQYRVESLNINEKWVSAQILKARHALRVDMQNRLNDIFSREQTELAQAQAKLVNDAIAFVRNKFAKRDSKTDQETIEFALMGLGEQVKLPKEQDPVRKAFIEFFKSRGIGKK